VDDFTGEPCTAKTPLFTGSVRGKWFLDVFHATEITAIEVLGDEVTLPTSLVVSLIMNGRYDDKKPIAVGEAPAVRVWLKDGDCFQMNVLLNPADRSVYCAQTPLGIVSASSDLKDKKLIPELKVGMTRAEVEKKVIVDGGLSSPFRYERYLVQNSSMSSDGAVVKLNLAFKPAGMSDAVYYLGKWTSPKESPKDVLMRISPPYREMAFSD
jgi:hypothetical protein